jgi:hypothetical protein
MSPVKSSEESAAEAVAVTPVPPDDTTEFDTPSFFTVTGDGCTIRFGIEQKSYHVALTLPNYNSLFSLLLACWVNRARVSLKLAALQPPTPPNAQVTTVSIVSATAMPSGSEG